MIEGAEAAGAFSAPRRAVPSLNLTALIDVVFILLIFVVLVANFDRLSDIEVNLPTARATGEVSPEALTLVVPLRGDPRLDGEPVAIADLHARFSALRASHESLILLADGAIAFERAVSIIGEASAAGFHNVSIAIREPGK